MFRFNVLYNLSPIVYGCYSFIGYFFISTREVTCIHIVLFGMWWQD